MSSALKNETAGGGQPGQIRWRNALVVTQLTVSLVLLLGAGLFLRSYERAQAADPGFGREPTALLTVMVPRTRYTPEAGRLYMDRLLGRFRELPGVEEVGVISILPLTLTSSSSNRLQRGRVRASDRP